MQKPPIRMENIRETEAAIEFQIEELEYDQDLLD